MKKAHAQHSTVQYSTVQYSIMLRSLPDNGGSVFFPAKLCDPQLERIWSICVCTPLLAKGCNKSETSRPVGIRCSFLFTYSSFNCNNFDTQRNPETVSMAYHNDGRGFQDWLENHRGSFITRNNNLRNQTQQEQETTWQRTHKPRNKQKTSVTCRQQIQKDKGEAKNKTSNKTVQFLFHNTTPIQNSANSKNPETNYRCAPSHGRQNPVENDSR